jgi:hypothetical protein
MSTWRMWCWLVIAAVCSGACLTLLISALSFAVRVPVEIVNVWGKSIAVATDQGLEFLFWFISALLGWVLKAICPFL